jgi:cell division protease FtsH
LKSPTRFSDLGARIPKGVLLVGPPGTGKTLLAKAVAGEADVPFFSISGSDFVELYVGVGASRVRDMFTQAKKHAPAIVFIDEIDAVGRQRGAGMGGGHDEREQTLNQLLVEMDGFGENEGVIIIAATNRPDILDPALLRPGRFDRQVTVLVPDVRGREAILRVHAKNKPLSEDVDLREIARTTAGFTGADLENLLNEAALLSARKDRRAITHEEIKNAMLKVVIGTEKKSHKKTEKDLNLTAYHEAGHAVSSHYLPTQDAVNSISVISRGLAGGFTMYLPTEDKESISKVDMEEDIVSLLGGRVAEALVLGDISTGASNDIQRATKLARDMVTRYGMSGSIGPIAYADEHEVFLGRDYGQTHSYSEYIAHNIDVEIKKIIDAAYKHCEQILQTHMAQLHTVAARLKERETLSGEEFRLIMEGKPLPPAMA